MEKNDTHTDDAPHGRSSDSIAPSPQGYYNTAGFGDRPEADQPTDDADANSSAANEPAGTGSNPSNGPGPAGFDTTVGGNPGRSSQAPPPPPVGYAVPKRLYRTEGPVSGVAAGLAEYFNLDEILIRILIVAGSIVAFPVVPLVYIAAVFIIPKKDDLSIAPIVTAPSPAPVNTVQDSVDSFSGR